VATPEFGLVTGRVSALALDPSDPTGNRLYAGATGGGVWLAQNAGTSTPSAIVFNPLTDNVTALSGATDASISIGALTVQPGGTGVVLAGTGDPSDALDSYYGVGILRSSDGGNSWSLISSTADSVWSFTGEGFAGFAWSTINPQLIVAAVSQAFEGTLVNAVAPHDSYQGLYYSTDAGATWNLATITDGAGEFVQGPNAAFAAPDGNAATSVVWNPVRKVFVAAVRYHGYYQSADGVTWTRMPAQPGSALTAALCPTNPGAVGSIACPIFRGTLAVNPETGDTFAWTTDVFNQDQGLWQDQCAISGGSCGNPSVTFARQWNMAAIETNTIDGAATVENGDYTLTLAAVPQQQDTILFAGADDLWKCSLAQGCVWRNTTNATTCMSAQVAEYQHALTWSTANPLEIFLGNDSGLWRSMDAIGETGSVCSAADASHFQNLNGSLGSLAEVVSMSASPATAYTMMAGLGVNGTAGVKNTTGPTANWPQIFGGDGGPVVIDPGNSSKWYVNNEPGVSIYLCDQTAACSPSGFGTAPLITDADVGGDGYTMPLPAPFLVDPLDATQLLIGTCRVWRGPASSSGWGAGNAVSPILDSGATNVPCNGDALIRSIAAQALPSGDEGVYVGMYGSLDGGANRAGHVFRAMVGAASGSSQWQDLSLNPVTNDVNGFNAFALDISSIAIDSHDPTGNTVYATVAGIPEFGEDVQTVYRSTDGGAHWASVASNLPRSPANSIAIDPQDANTVYLATDDGVYFTKQIGTCSSSSSVCWSPFGTGLPQAPVVALTAFSAASSTPVLAAATYGRGIWQTALWTASTGLTTASANPASLAFPSQTFGTTSGAEPVTLTNTGSLALTPAAISAAGDFNETDNCVHASIAPGASCTIEVTFAPTQTGNRAGQMTIAANVYGGQLSVSLSGIGVPAGAVALTPAALDFGSVLVGTTSASQPVEAANSSAIAVPITNVSITSPFTIVSNACGTTTLAAQTDCQISVAFAPTQTGAIAGTLTFTDGAGTQTVALTGAGAAAANDILNPLSLTFPTTALGQLSSAQVTTLTNTGGLPLTSIAISVSGPFTQTNNCGAQLPGPAYCSISVVYAPNQLGGQTGMLTVTDAIRTQTVTLSGTGAQPPVLSVSPAGLTFASQQVGVASSPLTLTVSNTGQAPLANIDFQITGPSASSFSIGASTCPSSSGATLNGGSSCTVQISFIPASTGGSAATLTVSTSTTGIAAVPVPLIGTGQIASGLNVNPSQLNFSVVTIGQSSIAQSVTVSNSSSIAAAGLTATASPPFSITQNTCGASLAAGASCTISAVFTPTTAGPLTGVLTISSAAIATPATVLLTGTGAVGAAIEISPGAIVFATTPIGTISAQTPVTITNTGASASLTNLVLAASAGFVLVNNNCGPTLTPGSSCTAAVEFSPTTGGAQTGSLTVTSSSVPTAASIPLSGLAFDFTLAVSGSASQTVSSGQTASYTLAITPLDGSQGAFNFQCGTLPANAICTFNPTTETLNGATGTVSVQISTGGSTAAARIAGRGAAQLLPLVCGLALLPFALWRRRNSLLLLALLCIFFSGFSACTSSGGGTGGGSTGGSKGASTPSGTYTIPVSASSNGIEHGVTLMLTVD
jgi:hypothetical protein